MLTCSLSLCYRTKQLVALTGYQSILIISRDDGGTIFCTRGTTLSSQ